MSTPPLDRTAREALNRAFFAHVPHNNALGIRIEAVAPGEATLVLPWAPHLVGNPETGALHGGAVTALIDTTCGAAVFQALTEVQPIATLDLRVDHLRAATAGRAVVAHAHTLRVSRHVAFVRCEAWEEGAADVLVAVAAGSFALGTRRGRHGPTGADNPWTEG